MANEEITQTVEKLESVAAKVETALTGDKTDASKILFYLGIGIIVVGSFIIYKKAQAAKKQNGGEQSPRS